MIDLATETAITFSGVSRYVPRRRRGRKVHPATPARWATRGVNGIILESLVTPGGRITTVEALQRFFERLTAAGEGRVPSVRTARQRERASESAERDLKEMGV